MLLGDIYTLAVSNTLTLLGSQTNHFFTRKSNGGVRFTCYSWPVNHYFCMLALGDVYSHPETTIKYTSPNVNMTPTTTTTLITYIWVRQQSRQQRSHVSYMFAMSAHIWQSWDAHQPLIKWSKNKCTNFLHKSLFKLLPFQLTFQSKSSTYLSPTD